MARVLAENDYNTAHFGKWHLGGFSPPGEKTPVPTDYGYSFSATHSSPVEFDKSLQSEKN